MFGLYKEFKAEFKAIFGEIDEKRIAKK